MNLYDSLSRWLIDHITVNDENGNGEVKVLPIKYKQHVDGFPPPGYGPEQRDDPLFPIR